MNISILNELIKKYKKNSKLSVNDTKIFAKELSELINEEYCNEVENILFEGPAEITMKVLADSVHNKEGEKLLYKFIFGKRISENKFGSSGIKIVYLFDFLLSSNVKNNNMLLNIFKNMVKLSYKSKDHCFNKKVIDLIRSNILKNDEFYKLNIGNLPSTIWPKTLELFIYCINSDDVLESIKEKVYIMLKDSKNDMGKYTKEYVKNNIFKNHDIYNKCTEIIKEKTDDESNLSVKDILKNIILYISEEHKVINNISSELIKTNNKLVDIQIQLKRSLDFQKKQELDINKLNKEKMDWMKKNNEYKDEIKNLNNIIAQLSNEVEERKQFIDAIDKNREKQSEEFINKLASKLRLDYNDFCDAKELDMTIDLGENMRAQLESVFSILKKNGINIG